MQTGKKRIYDLPELHELINKEHTCMRLKKCEKKVELSPKYIRNMKEGIRETLDKCLNKFDYSLNGFLLDYRNLKLVSDSSSGRFIGRFGEYLATISADFYVFQPEIGSLLEGTVHVKTKTHIGCLVHKCFNAMVPKPENVEYQNWNCKNIQINDKIVFEIVDHVFSGHVPYLEGKISEEYIAEMSKKTRKASSIMESTNQNGYMSEKELCDTPNQTVPDLNDDSSSEFLFISKSKEKNSEKEREKTISKEKDNDMNNVSISKLGIQIGSGPKAKKETDNSVSEVTKEKKSSKKKKSIITENDTLKSKLNIYKSDVQKNLDEPEQQSSIDNKRKKAKKNKQESEEYVNNQLEPNDVIHYEKMNIQNALVKQSDVQIKEKKFEKKKQKADNIADNQCETDLSVHSLTSGTQNLLGDKSGTKKKEKQPRKKKETTKRLKNNEPVENTHACDANMGVLDSLLKKPSSEKAQKKVKKKKEKTSEHVNNQMVPHPLAFHPHDLMMDIQNSSVNQSHAEKKQKMKKRKGKSDDSENFQGKESSGTIIRSSDDGRDGSAAQKRAKEAEKLNRGSPSKGKKAKDECASSQIQSQDSSIISAELMERLMEGIPAEIRADITPEKRTSQHKKEVTVQKVGTPSKRKPAELLSESPGKKKRVSELEQNEKSLFSDSEASQSPKTDIEAKRTSVGSFPYLNGRISDVPVPVMHSTLVEKPKKKKKEGEEDGRKDSSQVVKSPILYSSNNSNMSTARNTGGKDGKKGEEESGGKGEDGWEKKKPKKRKNEKEEPEDSEKNELIVGLINQIKQTLGMESTKGGKKPTQKQIPQYLKSKDLARLGSADSGFNSNADKEKA